MEYGRYSINPLFDNNSCSLNEYMRVEVDDGGEGQVFHVPLWLDELPIADIIEDIVDPQGQGRIVKSLVNEAGEVVNSINPLSFYPQRDFSKTKCMRLIAKWEKPRSKILQYIKRHIEKMKVTIEDVIESSVMIKLHEKELEKTKKILEKTKLEKGDLSSQSLILEMLQYIRSSIKEIEAFKKEYKAFKAYEKLEEDFNKVEEEVAFETFKRAFEDVKEPCKRLINQPMSSVAPLFQAFEEFCRAREIYVLGVLAQSACANDMRYFLPFGDHDDMIKDYLWERADILSNFYPESEFIRKLKEFVLNHLRFKIFMTEAWNDLSFANIDCTYLKKVSQRVGPVKYIHSCALSLEINIYLCEKLNGFSIDVIQKTELIHKIKKVLIDNVHFKYIGGEEGLFTGYPLAKDYDCAFSEDIDSKLLEVLRELPDVPDLTATKKMLREEWKKWAKVHNAFFPCFSI